MNCEQTRKNLGLHRQGSTMKGSSLQHLRTCTACQLEYEALWHTATVLENLEAPVPPPALVGKIQQGIRRLDKRQHVALFANPFAWCLSGLKLALSPKFVNVIALLFYLIASGSIVKLVFFTTQPGHDFGLTAMEEASLRNVKISPAPWAVIKGTKTEPAAVTIDIIHPKRHHEVNISHTDDMWRPRGADTEKSKWIQARNLQLPHIETVNTLSTIAVNQKLTVFWNHIKTGL